MARAENSDRHAAWIFAPVMLSHDAGIGHEDYPMINLWQRRVRRLEGFVTMPGIPDYF